MPPQQLIKTDLIEIEINAKEKEKKIHWTDGKIEYVCCEASDENF
jgi:hypothetical protein